MVLTSPGLAPHQEGTCTSRGCAPRNSAASHCNQTRPKQGAPPPAAVVPPCFTALQSPNLSSRLYAANCAKFHTRKLPRRIQLGPRTRTHRTCPTASIPRSPAARTALPSGPGRSPWPPAWGRGTQKPWAPPRACVSDQCESSPKKF